MIMRKSRVKHALLAAMAIALAGCGGGGTGSAAQEATIEIQGELNESSYRQAAEKVLAETRPLLSSPDLSEQRLDAAAAKIEALLKISGKLDVDKSRLDEPELMSLLGALYTRKAAFHIDNAQQAGVYTSKGFRHLDRAVAKYPDNISARINRGMTAAKVPEFMNKTGLARDDLKYVAESPEFSRLPPGLQASVRSTLAELDKRLSQQASQP